MKFELLYSIYVINIAIHCGFFLAMLERRENAVRY